MSSKDKLERLGYIIHYEGTDKYGEFRWKEDTNKRMQWQGQKNYDLVGDVLMELIQEQMVNLFGLRKVMFPEDADLEEDYRHLPRCDIYMSEDVYDKSKRTNEKLLVLIQGTGAVRAGVWARSVCINESLKNGSMLPLIDIGQ